MVVKNKYTIEGNVACIRADGAGKYSVNILINAKRLALVDKASSGYWQIIKERDQYYAATLDGKNIIYMHDLITGIGNKQCEEHFIEKNGSNCLITNPYYGKKAVVFRGIDDGLCNLDGNLMIEQKPEVTEQLTNDYEFYHTAFLKEITDDQLIRSDFLTLLNSDVKQRTSVLADFFTNVKQIVESPISRVLPNYEDYQILFEMLQNNHFDGQRLGSFNPSLGELDDIERYLEFNYRSNYLLPDHLLIITPILKTLKANKVYTCMFSGTAILPGEQYIYYQVFIQDLTDNMVYVLREPWRAMVGYEYDLPNDLPSLEQFHIMLKNAYISGNDDFYNIQSNLSSDGVVLTKLKRRK